MVFFTWNRECGVIPYIKSDSVKYLSILINIFFLTNHLIAQPSGLSLSSAFTGSCTYSLSNADAFSFLQNPAALPAITSLSAAVSGERRYMLQELAHYETAIVIPSSSGTFGVRGSYFGSAPYHKTIAGLAYGRRINKIDVGLQAGYTNATASGYASQNSIIIEGGVIFQLSEQLRLGFHVFDPVALQLKNNDPPVTSFSAGIGYDGSGNFHFEILLQKEERIPVNVCTAIHYAAGEKIFFRMGISCSTPMIFAGAGCMLQNIRVDAIATYHPYLGITPAIAFVFKKSS